MSRPTGFVVLSTQRSGSSWLVDLLNDHPGVVAYAELFRVRDSTVAPYGATVVPPFRAMVPREKYAVSSLLVPRRYAYVRGLERAHPAAQAVGFKLMYDQTRDHPGLLEILAVRRARVVHLLRGDHVRAAVSYEIAERRGSWHRRAGEPTPSMPVRIEPDALIRRIEEREQEIHRFRRTLRRLPVRVLEVRYEQLVERRDEVLSGVFDFLRVVPAAIQVRSPLVRATPRGFADVVENLGEVRSALSRTRFAPQLVQLG